MSLRNTILIGFFLSLSVLSFAQDTLKIMQYNLLYYGKDVYDCNSTNNNIDHKNTQLQTILAYSQPDIFCVNEMDASSTDVDYLMDNALNIGGVSHWQHASVSGSYSINMIYYNSDKFTLSSQESITASPRQTNVYHLTHIASGTDFTVIVVHLKAGSYADDEDDKANATQNVMNYIDSRGAGNYIFMGDLNIYSSSSESFQNLINPSNSSIAFYDPINRIGSWSNNYSYSDVHTQATHTSGDCFVTGGMDDRFDFIMISEDIKDGNNEIQYISNSYETIGQDGNHYNDALTDGTNNSAPSNVITALYEMSDHLPVSMEVVFGSPSAIAVTVFNKTFDNQDITSGGWSQFSVLDNERIWHIPDNIYGHNDTYYGMMTGYDYTNNVTVDNEDWLISPSFNADELFAETLTFWTSSKYSGNNLQVYYSSNYTGTGDPSSATWTEITGFNLSTVSDFVWESSGDIDLTNIIGSDVRVGFKYTSTEASGSRTWQIDDILLVGNSSDASISERKSSPKTFSIFPNPTQGNIQISINNVNGKPKYADIQVYNISGALVLSSLVQTSAKQIFDISTLNKGVYFVKIGQEVQKLVVE